MKYRITHITEYFYGESVPLCHNIVHLRPRDTETQTTLLNEIEVTPVPASRRNREDFFGNHLTWFSIQEPHESLRVEAISEVEVMPFQVPDGLDGTWENARQIVQSSLDPVVLDARQFIYASPYIPTNQELADYALPSFAPGRPLLEGIRELTKRIHGDFIFDARATSVGTPVMQVLRGRRGVCQDFAHLQIGCLRSIGLAARYVSGYLLTKPPPGKKRLVGADASHAWLSVFLPGFGWIDFDPTNDCIPSDEHITLAWARDYEDVGPVKGVIIGGHQHSVDVSVDVQPILEETVPA